MKPLRLRFAAFGSYPGEELVDFAALAQRGLFVVTGPTGSGKTTIFDAMVFALYGRLPGSRDAREVRPRSHHAAPDRLTFVEFDFEVDGERYRVYRTPTQERPKLKGSGVTTDPTNATLARIVNGVPESVETQAGRVTDKCEEFVGLDVEQFQRVVLLPQGKFTAFLLASEDERETLLRPLFGGEVYQEVVKWLKGQSESLSKQVRDSDVEIEHFRTNARESLRRVWEAWGRPVAAGDAINADSDSVGVDELDDAALLEAVAALAPVRAEQEAAVAAARETAAASRKQATQAAEAAKVFDTAQGLDEAVRTGESERAQREADRARVAASRAARPVDAAARALATAEADDRSAKQSLDAVLAEVHDGFGALGVELPAADPGAIGAAVQAAASAVELDAQLVGAASAAAQLVLDTEAKHREAAEHYEAAEKAAAALHAELTEHTERIAQLEPEAARVTELATARKAAAEQREQRSELDTKRASRAKADTKATKAQRAYEQVMERFVRTQAPRLAAELHEGEACPVCGSVEHPAKAVFAEGDEVTHAEVDAARAAWDTAQRAVGVLDGAIDALEASLGDLAGAEIDTLVAAEQAAVKAHENAATSARLLQTTKSELDTVQKRLVEAQDARSDRRSAADALAALLADRAGEAERLAAASAHIDAAALARRQEAVAALAGATASVGEVFARVASCGAAVDAARRTLGDALSASGYASVEAALAALIDSVDEQALEAAVERWSTDLAAAESKLEILRSQGVPEERPDAEALEQQARSVETTANELGDEFLTASNELRSAGESLAQAVRLGAGSADLRRAADTARRVFETCNGRGPGKVNLERWVLARELETVTAYANEHLARMSNRRYVLQRDESQGGLRLEVFDAHTGKTRATNSLSGGEQFQASLALALGLADVVSLGGSASGKQFDALFVDEGFGSLDQQSLGDAINALEMIQSTGRTVGAITHVEEMKERLHKGIEVFRLPDDRGSTLRVNP